MVQDKRSFWLTVISSAITVLLVMYGMRIANEHRMTILEQNVVALTDNINATNKTLEKLSVSSQKTDETLAKLTTLIDMTCKRHEMEDKEKERKLNSYRDMLK